MSRGHHHDAGTAFQSPHYERTFFLVNNHVDAARRRPTRSGHIGPQFSKFERETPRPSPTIPQPEGWGIPGVWLANRSLDPIRPRVRIDRSILKVWFIPTLWQVKTATVECSCTNM